MLDLEKNISTVRTIASLIRLEYTCIWRIQALLLVMVPAAIAVKITLSDVLKITRFHHVHI